MIDAFLIYLLKSKVSLGQHSAQVMILGVVASDEKKMLLRMLKPEE